MSTSPRLPKNASQTTSRPVSAPMLLLATALDTTWRAFVPTIGGVFLGIGIDYWLGIAPIATIICLILGTAASIGLIAHQLITVRSNK